MDREAIEALLLEEIIPKVVEDNLAEEEEDEFGLQHEVPDLSEMGPDTPLMSALDSLLFLDLILTVEDRFGIEFDEEETDIDLLASPGVLANTIAEEVAAKAAADDGSDASAGDDACPAPDQGPRDPLLPAPKEEGGGPLPAGTLEGGEPNP